METQKRFGEHLLERGEISGERLHAALEHQRALREQKLGELLIARRLLTLAQLRRALGAQAGRPLGQVLVGMGLLTERQLDDALAAQHANRRKRIGEVMVELGMISRATLWAALAALNVTTSGCAVFAGNDVMVKAREVDSVTVVWRKAAPKGCGEVKHAYGCATTWLNGSVCVIELPENAPDWALAHEIKHCFGYVHKGDHAAAAAIRAQAAAAR
jgi:hypothetical protein